MDLTKPVGDVRVAVGRAVGLERWRHQQDRDDRVRGVLRHAHDHVARPARRVRVYLGCDDSITVWLNGQQVLAHLVGHWAAPDQETVELDLKAGENRFTMKLTNGVQDAAFYFALRPSTHHQRNPGADVGSARARLSRRDTPADVCPRRRDLQRSHAGSAISVQRSARDSERDTGNTRSREIPAGSRAVAIRRATRR